MVIGPPRHLSLLPEISAERIVWPQPFADGLPLLLGLRGRRAVALASGDPFWFGAGRVIAETLSAGEWRALPAPSTFALAAARLGWGLEATTCLGLHAAPLARLRPHLAPGQRILVLLRDGDAPHALAAYLHARGFGPSQLTVLEALGGPNERVTRAEADSLTGQFLHPLCVAVEVAGAGAALPQASGLDDEVFLSDGQITKRPVRALALSALAPRAGELLWDIGGGSGSIAIEWLLAHPATEALCVEKRPDRADRIRENAEALGVDRLRVVNAEAPEALHDLPAPDAIFIGGGLSGDLMEAVGNRAPAGCRVVAHAVTLESEALLTDLHARKGGELLRMEIAHARPLGQKHGWKAAYPVVQWRGVL